MLNKNVKSVDYNKCKECQLIANNYFRLVSIYGNSDDAIQDCWCDKLGCKISWAPPCEIEPCEIGISNMDNMEYKKENCIYGRIPSRMTRYERNYRHKKKLRHFYDSIQPKWSASGVYMKHCGTSNEFLCRYYRKRYSRYLKRKSNKSIRRYKSYISNGGFYKKIFDYWWELW